MVLIYFFIFGHFNKCIKRIFFSDFIKSKNVFESLRNLFSVYFRLNFSPALNNAEFFSAFDYRPSSNSVYENTQIFFIRISTLRDYKNQFFGYNYPSHSIDIAMHLDFRTKIHGKYFSAIFTIARCFVLWAPFLNENEYVFFRDCCY